MEELKGRIAAARKLSGLTQEQLGELVGVTRQAVSKWESGQTVPDAVTVARICEALHVSADYVLLGKEPEAEAAVTAYTLPDSCPCCGRPVSGTVCPGCGYPLPTTPPRGSRYAIVSDSNYGRNPTAENQLMRYCGMSENQAQAMLEIGTATRVLLRRDLTDSAAQYITAHLDRNCFNPVIVEDAGESEDALRVKAKAMELPASTTPEKSGIGFWGVVGAVIVALLILSFL